MNFKDLKVGFAITGSFCTITETLQQLEELVRQGASVTPIMSEIVYSTDTRFGNAADFIWKVEDMTGKKIIHSITSAEPIGPQKSLDILIIAPCTGNTLSKLANGINDSTVTMAANAV